MIRTFATLVFTISTMIAAVAHAEPVTRITWRELAAHPDRYVGREIEIAAGYCTQAGIFGAGRGYNCSTDGDVYIAARELLPASEKKKVNASCGGLDLIERSSFCLARVRFTPTSFRKSHDIDPPKAVILINTEVVYLKY